jgi:hypothetical protein
MDPTDLIKHAPDILKGGAALAGALKLTDVIKAFLGPATAEIAERFRDDVRLYRYGRQLECLKKAEKMAKAAGFTPKAVPIKLLFPLLDGASLEENEDLHTMWAALLANAASPETAGIVRPGFIAILKQMAPDEAALLKGIADSTEGYESFLRGFRAPSKQLLDRAISGWRQGRQIEQLRAGFRRENEDDSTTDLRLETCVQLLERSGLIEVGEGILIMSALGKRFLESCNPPKSKA